MWHLCDIWRRGCAGRFWTGNASDSACTRSRPSTRASTLRARKACGGCAWNSRNPDSAKGPRLCQSAAPFLPPQGLNNKTTKLTADFPFSKNWQIFVFFSVFMVSISRKGVLLFLPGEGRASQSTEKQPTQLRTDRLKTDTSRLFIKTFSSGGIWSCGSWARCACCKICRTRDNGIRPWTSVWPPREPELGKGALLTPKITKNTNVLREKKI